MRHARPETKHTRNTPETHALPTQEHGTVLSTRYSDRASWAANDARILVSYFKDHRTGLGTVSHVSWLTNQVRPFIMVNGCLRVFHAPVTSFLFTGRAFPSKTNWAFCVLFCPSWLKKFAFPHPHAMLQLQELPEGDEADPFRTGNRQTRRVFLRLNYRGCSF